MTLLIFTGYSGFTNRTHSISRLISKEFQELKISKIVFGKHNFKFLKEQKEVNYEKIVKVEEEQENILKKNKDYSEEEIEKIEKFIGTSLTRLAYSERTFVRHTHDMEYSGKISHRDIINFTCALIENIDQIVKGKKIIFVYTCASIVSEILYFLSIKYQIKFYTLTEVRMITGFFLADNNKEYISEIFDRFDEAKVSNDGLDLYNDYLERIKKSEQNLVHNQHIKRVHSTKRVTAKNIFRFIKNFILDPETHFMSPTRFQRLKFNIMHYIRLYYQNKNSQDFLPKNKYVYYPLATIPEASTLIRGIDFFDELSNVKLISLNIPINYKLVVKLHPNMKGRNTIKFLKDLNKIFNVHVVNYSVLSNEILKNAECVITASGTTGLESLALGKKTVIIGHPSYGYLKSCFKINSFSELGNIMKLKWSNSLIDKQIEEVKIYASQISGNYMIKDKDGVIWNVKPKAFTNQTIDFDLNFYNIFKTKIEKYIL